MSSGPSRKTSTLVTLSVLALVLVNCINAETILEDNLTGVSKTNATATIESWDTQAGVAAGLSFSAVNQAGIAADYFLVRTNHLDVDATAGSIGAGWDVIFSLELAGPTKMQLNFLNLSGYLINSSGDVRDNVTSDRMWTLSIIGDGTYGTNSASATTTYSPTTPAPTTQIDLSGMPPLVTGENYTMIIGVRFVSGISTYQALSSISLDGTVLRPPGTVITLY